MADGIALPRVITNERVHCGQTLTESTKRRPGGGSTGAMVASRYNSFEMGKFRSQPKRDTFDFWRPETTVVWSGVGR